MSATEAKEVSKKKQKGPLSLRYDPVKKYKMASKYSKGEKKGEKIHWHRPTVVRRKHMNYAYGSGTRGTVVSRSRSQTVLRKQLHEIVGLYKKYFLHDNTNILLTTGVIDSNLRQNDDLINRCWEKMAAAATDSKGRIHQVTGRHAQLVADSFLVK
jgi:hypothetical protein